MGDNEPLLSRKRSFTKVQDKHPKDQDHEDNQTKKRLALETVQPNSTVADAKGGKVADFPAKVDTCDSCLKRNTNENQEQRAKGRIGSLAHFPGRMNKFLLKVKTLEEDNFRLQDKLEEADSKREDFQVELEKLVDENKKMRMENERLALELSKCQELIQQLGDEKREIKVENERLNLEVSMSQELNQQLAACNESIQAELKRTQESYQQKDVLGTLNELLEDQEKIQGIDDESMYKNIEDKLEEALTITRKAKEDYIRQSAVASFITNSKGNPDCVICMENPKEILINPCKHFCLCLVCSDRVTNCPLCKQLIESKDRIFAS